MKLAPDITEVSLELQEGTAGRGKVLFALFLRGGQLFHLLFAGFPVPSSIVAFRPVAVDVLLGGWSPCELVVALANQVDARTLPLPFPRLGIALGFLAMGLPLEELLLGDVQP